MRAPPVGAASLVAYQNLLASNFFSEDDTVVLFNTGSGLKYLDVLDTKDKSAPSPASRAIAGIIGPY
jgi:threonine synthase